MPESNVVSASLLDSLPVLSTEDELPFAATDHELVLVWLTPDLARRLLQYNTPDRQRRMRESHVERQVKHLKSGTWNELFDPFRFSKPEIPGDPSSAILLDGQHRLQAVIQSGIAYRALMLFGCDPSEQAHMDQNAKRTFADTLKFQGFKDPNNLAAVSNKIYSYMQTKPLANQRTTLRMWPTPLQDDVLPFVYDHQDSLYEALSIAASVHRHVSGAKKSSIAAVAWILMRVDKLDAHVFFQRLATGEELRRGDPVHTLRQRLLNSAARRERLTDDEAAALMIKSWNYYRKGQSLQVLSWKAGGSSPEAFPDPV